MYIDVGFCGRVRYFGIHAKTRMDAPGVHDSMPCNDHGPKEDEKTLSLAFRKDEDRFIQVDAYESLKQRLRKRSAHLADIPTVVLSAFDRSARLLPFVFVNCRMPPAAARTVAGSLYDVGFSRMRAVFQLWNPRFKPSLARIDGRPVEILLISSMQVHSRAAYSAARDVGPMGDHRPLVIVGGPKAQYEPHDFWTHPGLGGAVPDVAVTGEVCVLLQLLDLLVQYQAPGETLRHVFERARNEGALEDIPGLFYLSPKSTPWQRELVDTGLPRLVKDLDQLPGEAVGLRLLEPPHWQKTLSPHPLSGARLRKYCLILSLQITQGCRRNCGFCPIPAANQRSWRFRSPDRIVREIRSVYEQSGIKQFFGTDDNFFNRRDTDEAILKALAAARTNGRRIGELVSFHTEATEIDTYKNRDLLPLARAAGLRGVWFGIEDLTASLVDKGQNPHITTELFRRMLRYEIQPHAMLIFHDGQPFRTRDGLYGTLNQVRFLRRIGATSVQCTVYSPAVGARDVDTVYRSGRVLKQLGRFPIPDSAFDGSHLLVVGADASWGRQLQLLGAYVAFYNSLNLIRILLNREGKSTWRRRAEMQLIGIAGTLWTALKITPYVLRLMTLTPCFHSGAPTPTIPVLMTPNAFPRFLVHPGDLDSGLAPIAGTPEEIHG